MKLLCSGNCRIIPWRLLSVIALIGSGACFHVHAQQTEAPVFTLNDCIEIALKNNPQILSSGLTVEESHARIREVESGYYPTLLLNRSQQQG